MLILDYKLPSNDTIKTFLSKYKRIKYKIFDYSQFNQKFVHYISDLDILVSFNLDILSNIKKREDIDFIKTLVHLFFNFEE